MDKVLDRIATALEHIAVALANPMRPVDPAANEARTTAPAKTTRAKKAEAPAAVAAPAEPDALFEDAPAEELAPAKVPTLAEVSDAIRQVIATDKVNGNANARSVLAKFNCSRISEVKPENFAAIIGQMQALLKAK